MRVFLILICLIFRFPFLQLHAAERMFDFQLPWDDSSVNATDFSYLNHKPAGKYGFLKTGNDGHIYAGGKRIRFVGVNVTHRSGMPGHADAEKISRRLAKFGINLVRFHLIDADWGSRLIFDPPGTRKLNADALDRMDYFVSELKKNGIYSNINLLAGRQFESTDGVTSGIDQMEWKKKQTPALFDPAMIQLQKEYATQLLDRVNPYTGISYLEDPAIAFVEIVNEHGLMHGFYVGDFDDLPSDFSSQIKQEWNQYLHSRYTKHTNLVNSWAKSTESGPELLRNRNFASGLTYWNPEQHQGAAATFIAGNNLGPGNSPAVRIQVTKTSSESWHIQFNQPGLAVEEGKVYTLSFWAKADRNKTIEVLIEQAHDPWLTLGFSKPINLSTAWKKFTFSLELNQGDSNARLNFRRLGDQLATYYLADISLSEGGTIGVFPDENLDTGQIRLFTLEDWGERTISSKNDWMSFLWDKEEDYWIQMRDHLKKTLRVRALLMGTIVGTSTPNLMNLFDVVDSHAYWQHPAWAGESWNSPWWLTNSSMVSDPTGGTVADLSLKRIIGKPFSVSEYGHPFPMTFGSEAYYFLAVFAAFQDWDAIYGYTYADGTLNWSEDRQNGFFDLHHDPGKMMSFGFASAMFRRGDIDSANQLVAVGINEAEEKNKLPSVGGWRLLDAEHFGIPGMMPLLHQTAIVAEGGKWPSDAKNPSEFELPEDGRFVSDTGQITWDTNHQVLQINSPRTKGVMGKTIGKKYDLNGIVIEPKSSLQDWAAVFLTSLDNRSVGKPGFLIAVHGVVQNTGIDYRNYPSNTSAGNPPPSDVRITLEDWGRAPVLVEGVEVDLTLPFPADKVQLFALDNRGERKTEIPVNNHEGKAAFKLSADYQTLWYEAEISPSESIHYIPGFHMNNQDFLGIASVNPSGQNANLWFNAYNLDGSLALLPRNPAQIHIGPQSQSARLGTEIWGDTEGRDQVGWVEIISDNPQISIFAQQGDYQLNRLDGGISSQAPSKKTYLTRIYEGEKHFFGKKVSTVVQIANPGEADAEIKLSLIFPDPEATGEFKPTITLAETEVSIPAKGAVISSIIELFEVEVTGGILEITVEKGDGIVASSQIVLPDTNTLFALNASSESDFDTLYSAQLASIADLYFTNLKLFNIAPSLRSIRLKAVANDGNLLFDPYELELESRELFEANLLELLKNNEIPGIGGLNSKDQLIGSLIIEIIEGDGIIGDVVFGQPGLENAAALPLQGRLFKKAVFGHIANSPDSYFTGLAVLNPGNEIAELNFQLFSPQGQLVGSGTSSLGPGTRLSQLLVELVPESSRQMGGFVILQSEQPLVAQQLFGTVNLRILSSVPAMTIE